ncbi:ferrous iron transporter B [Phyllobacterium leguminum]|uniref:Ferrous iron transport protein B n=1 Tax=Phyllobacterium leguminum TaxID=314237 RepID=A0A318T6V0_9HYPH|nr:ferrous iron transporter B [Phyllobacterium leguminum]PYE90172.1 ferrous iron transport protein B [Phyllobacterium leguminum]
MLDTTKQAVRRIALVGAPNCGKTALFNALTGSRQKVGNYAGVTVERKKGVALTPGGRSLEIVDLPGTYSLRARSPDEEITRDVVLDRRPADTPDLLLAVADATNLRSAFRLVCELVQTGKPLVLVLNMIDIARHRGIEIETDALSRQLGIPVVAACAVRRAQMADLWQLLDQLSETHTFAKRENNWSEPSATQLRNLQREADRLIAQAVRYPEKPDNLTTRIDSVLLHPVAGLLVLLTVLFLMFQAVFDWAQPPMDLITSGFDTIGTLIQHLLGPGLVESFLVDGAIAGVGSVVSFLPQILIMFLFILLLEDLGYMARAAFLMDRIMGGVGLHGRAFIPLLSSFACAIPGIMAARVIDNRRDRMTTILVAPLMTCSARIPIYTLIIAAFIPAHRVAGFLSLQGLVMFGLYAVGIVSALGVSLVAKLIFWRNQPAPPFMLELPDYKLPRLKNVLIALMTRVKMFLHRAGTTIFTMTVVIWFLATFPMAPANATQPAIFYSFAAMIGHLIEPLLAPIGFTWQMSVALVPGMAAREVVVAALGTVYSIQGGADAALQVGHVLASQWTLPTALSFLAWYIFAPQCTSTLAVIKREAGGARWMWLSFGYMLALAYVASFIVYHIALAV